jgi:succinate dehydrogenase/fumarate reductase flavoprotein subunit
LIATYYANCRAALDEIESLGLPIMEFPSNTGDYEAMVEYHSDIEHGNGTHIAVEKPTGGWGAGIHLMARLAQLAEEGGVDLWVDHRVTDVILNDQKEVVGVTASTKNGKKEIFAQRAVVFASGGYAHNPQMMERYFPAPMYGSCAVSTARGDFIGIAEKLDAELGNMGHGWGTQHPLEMMLDNREVMEHVGVYPGDSLLMVNLHGRRVVSEKLTYHERSLVHYERDDDGALPNHLLFLVYDEWVANQPADQPNRWPSPEPQNWWVISGSTIAELAENIRLRLESYADRLPNISLSPEFADNLAKEVTRFNSFAAAGVDDDFHRGETDVELDWSGPCHIDNQKNPTMYPLDDGPYHAIILAGSVLDTNGGPKALTNGRIAKNDGSTIPGLYGVGNCVASAAGAGYWTGGSTLGPALVFSYLVAEDLESVPSRLVVDVASGA